MSHSFKHNVSQFIRRFSQLEGATPIKNISSIKWDAYLDFFFFSQLLSSKICCSFEKFIKKGSKYKMVDGQIFEKAANFGPYSTL